MVASSIAFGISANSIVCNENMPIMSEPIISEIPKLYFFLIKRIATVNAMTTPIIFNMVYTRLHRD